jgi:hypothetical protein
MTAGSENRAERRTVRERFGGVDTPAAIGGMTAMLGTLVFLASLIAAGAGTLDYRLNAIDIDGNLQELEFVTVIIAGLVVLASGFVGGWVAARMARFDGVINGVAAAVWLVALVAVFAALGAFFGAEYNAFQRAGLPDWFSQITADDVTAMAVIGGLVGIATLFLGAALGGNVGEGYNRRVNRAIAGDAVGRDQT